MEDRFPVRQVLEGMLSEEIEEIDELADYRAGVTEGTGKCSREGLEGWLKRKKAILPTRIQVQKRLNHWGCGGMGGRGV